MVDYYAALSKAWAYHDTARRGGKVNSEGAVKELAALSLFTPAEVARILDSTVQFVKSHWGMHDNASWPQRVWNASDLDLLMVVAYSYTKGRVSHLIPALVRNGNSIKAVSELTGVPLDEVRGAVG